MEDSLRADGLVHQKNLAKALQPKSKPFLSPKLHRSLKKDKASWIFKKKQLGESRSSRAAPEEEDEEDAEEVKVRSSSPKPTASSQLVGSHPKPLRSISPQPPGWTGQQECLDESERDTDRVGHDSKQAALSSPGMYMLDIVLRRGHNLAIRDRGGTSDPYVKFKLGRKEVYRSKIIYKSLNPVWEEHVILLTDNLHEPLYIKVFDYDFGCHDDFMGSAYLHLDSLEHGRPLDVKLELQDLHCPDEDLGTLELVITLTPRDGVDLSERGFKAHGWKPYVAKTMLLTRTWKRGSKQQQGQRLCDVHKKSQLWRSVVSITLIEGRDLVPMDQNGLSDPYVKFRLGNEKYKSKTMPKTLNPQWREQFDLHVFDEMGGILNISVWDKDTGKKDDFIGRCELDLSMLTRERTHKVELDLEDDRGRLVLLVTLTASSTVSISDLSVNVLDNPHERRQILKKYSLLRSICNLRDIGVLQVKVLRAEGLMAADVTGKSDPFCVVELCNDRLQTHTVYKNLNPEWNKVFTLNIKDIHAVLEVSVYDEDRDKSADFLGKVAIPLLRIHSGEQKAYMLKNKELTALTKGVIFLEADIIFNIVRASLRTFVPAEHKYIEEEPKVSKTLLQQNFTRVKRCIVALINVGSYINSCFEWESPKRSIFAFLLFVVAVWNFELYMVPLALLIYLGWNYFLLASGKETQEGNVQAVEDLLKNEEDECERDDKGFMDKLHAIQDVCISVQSALDEVASFGERMKNTFNWTVPFLSWLAITVLCVASFIMYMIPLRYIVLVWGINKFTKKLRNPYLIDNNELLDFLSRVPSDIQVVQYSELKTEAGQIPNKKK